MVEGYTKLEAHLVKNSRSKPVMDSFWEMMTGDEESTANSEDESYESHASTVSELEVGSRFSDFEKDDNLDEDSRASGASTFKSEGTYLYEKNSSSDEDDDESTIETLNTEFTAVVDSQNGKNSTFLAGSPATRTDDKSMPNSVEKAAIKNSSSENATTKTLTFSEKFTAVPVSSKEEQKPIQPMVSKNEKKKPTTQSFGSTKKKEEKPSTRPVVSKNENVKATTQSVGSKNNQEKTPSVYPVVTKNEKVKPTIQLFGSKNTDEEKPSTHPVGSKNEKVNITHNKPEEKPSTQVMDSKNIKPERHILSDRERQGTQETQDTQDTKQTKTTVESANTAPTEMAFADFSADYSIAEFSVDMSVDVSVDQTIDGTLEMSVDDRTMEMSVDSHADDFSLWNNVRKTKSTKKEMANDKKLLPPISETENSHVDKDKSCRTNSTEEAKNGSAKTPSSKENENAPSAEKAPKQKWQMASRILGSIRSKKTQVKRAETKPMLDKKADQLSQATAVPQSDQQASKGKQQVASKRAEDTPREKKTSLLTKSEKLLCTSTTRKNDQVDSKEKQQAVSKSPEATTPLEKKPSLLKKTEKLLCTSTTRKNDQVDSKEKQEAVSKSPEATTPLKKKPSLFDKTEMLLCTSTTRKNDQVDSKEIQQAVPKRVEATTPSGEKPSLLKKTETTLRTAAASRNDQVDSKEKQRPASNRAGATPLDKKPSVFKKFRTAKQSSQKVSTKQQHAALKCVETAPKENRQAKNDKAKPSLHGGKTIEKNELASNKKRQASASNIETVFPETKKAPLAPFTGITFDSNPEASKGKQRKQTKNDIPTINKERGAISEARKPMVQNQIDTATTKAVKAEVTATETISMSRLMSKIERDREIAKNESESAMAINTISALVHLQHRELRQEALPKTKLVTRSEWKPETSKMNRPIIPKNAKPQGILKNYKSPRATNNTKTRSRQHESSRAEQRESNETSGRRRFNGIGHDTGPFEYHGRESGEEQSEMQKKTVRGYTEVSGRRRENGRGHTTAQFEDYATKPLVEPPKLQKETVRYRPETAESKKDDYYRESFAAPSDEETLCNEFIELVIQPQMLTKYDAMDAPKSRFWPFRRS